MGNNIKNKFIWNEIGSVVIGVVFSFLVIYFIGAEVLNKWQKVTSSFIEVTIIIMLLMKCFSFIGWYLAIDDNEDQIEFFEILVYGYSITIVFTIVMLDFMVYPNYNVAVLYTLAVPFGWFSASKNGTITASIWAVVLCLGSYLIIPNPGAFNAFIVDRLSSLAVIVMVGVFLRYFKINRYKLKKTNRILNQKNIETELKSKELEQYVYTVSHDLKEPLRSLSVILDIFMKSNQSKIVEDDLELLGLVKKSTLKMGKSIDAVLDYSKLGQNFNLENVDINKVVNDVIFELDDDLKKEDVSFDIQGLGSLKVYLSDFQILMTNLISNALQYRKKGTICEISILRKDIEDFAVFYVKDNGIGIEKENHERIFKIFQSLKPDSNRKGLGLAHSSKIAELHKGDIKVESKFNEGSTFIVKISKKLK